MLEASQIEKMSVAEGSKPSNSFGMPVCHETRDLPSPDWHRQVLAERKLRAEKGESKFLTLAQLRSRLQGSEP